MSHALISITVAKFVPLIDAAAKRRTIASQVSYQFTPHPAGGVKMFNTNGDLRVWKPGRHIRFVFADPQYRPTGISFYQTGTDNSDRYGVRNMTERGPGQDSGQPPHFGFKATRADAGTTVDKFMWKFAITFEEVATGRPGIIDPEISNTTAEDLTKKDR